MALRLLPDAESPCDSASHTFCIRIVLNLSSKLIVKQALSFRKCWLREMFGSFAFAGRVFRRGADQTDQMCGAARVEPAGSITVASCSAHTHIVGRSRTIVEI